MSWPQKIKKQAREMRVNGASLGEITKQLHVSKSTLSLWLKGLVSPLQYEDQKEWLKLIRPLAARKIRETRENELKVIAQRAKQEVERWDFLQSKQAQKALLAMLYWAEGQKLPERGAPVKFANTDPRMIALFVALLKRCYPVDPKKIKVFLYLHWYHKENEVKVFWKSLLGVEENQFRKVYKKKRSQTKRFRKNFMGICFIIYQDVDLRHEIVDTALAIQERLVKTS